VGTTALFIANLGSLTGLILQSFVLISQYLQSNPTNCHRRTLAVAG
jgi:hypothetical protein